MKPGLNKNIVFNVLLFAAAVVVYNARACADVPIVLSGNATQVERIAAQELRFYLSSFYRRERFAVSAGDAGSDPRRLIRIGTPVSNPELLRYLGGKKLQGPESYVITHSKIGGNDVGLIIGADPSGVIYGVYGLLKKMGFGFHLTEDTFVRPTDEPFESSGWNLVNKPMVKERIVFNWHNFITGCTGWDFEQWQQWIVQSQKMGYNTIMVHAYGNNPMFSYSFEGIEKPVGFIATSRRGRDWGNQHINDVRRLPGGWVFDKAEFGSEAALVPEEDRIEAKQSLMKKVFSLAEKRGMKICFALDVDTNSVLPQEMILKLNEKDRFHNGSMWLPRPDRKGGRKFYEAQIRALLKLYPEIDTIALWRRGHGQEWGRLKRSEQLPTEWKKEYENYIRRNPGAEKTGQSVCGFALNKVAGAFRSVLDETGRGDVRLAMGSWGHEWVESAVEFLPDEVTVMPLDWGCMKRYAGGSFLRVPEKYKTLAVSKGRVVPIIWAHHDDGEYVGRPLECHKDFYATLADLQARGFGVIHWMNRPLDLYFINHINQVWSDTLNQDIKRTCDDMAVQLFGESQKEHLSNYLYRWITEAPAFGRATSDHFFLRDECIANPEEALRKSQERFDSLGLYETDINKMTMVQRDRRAYFRMLEGMIMSVCRAQEFAYRPAVKALEIGDYSRARKLLAGANPGIAISWFSRLSQSGTEDRGEKAMVLSLGTRWLTDYLAARQAAGSEDIRINFGPTSHEPLAQIGGKYTYHVDPDGNFWSVRGMRETNRAAVDYSESNVVPPAEASETVKEIVNTGIVFDKPTKLKISPMVNLHKKVAPGKYRLTVYCGCAAGEKTAKGRFSAGVSNKAGGEIYAFKNDSGTVLNVYKLDAEFVLDETSMPQLHVSPQNSSVVIYGMKLERIK